MDKLNATLTAVQSLRSSMRQCFEHLSNATDSEGDDNAREKFVQDFLEKFDSIEIQLCDVESLIDGLEVPKTADGNVDSNTCLAEETSQDREALYAQLVHSYNWIDKVHDHSFFAFNNLNQNSLRRSDINCSPQRTSDQDHIDKLFNEVVAGLPHTTYKVIKPFGSNAIVLATINHVLKAAIVFNGVGIIEWVTVKSYNEVLEHNDLWTESRYKVFRKVQEHAQSAMLHFFSPTQPDLAVKSFVTWLNSYNTLYSERCKRCSKTMSNLLPPTWRDLHTLEPFHEECRNC